MKPYCFIGLDVGRYTIFACVLNAWCELILRDSVGTWFLCPSAGLETEPLQALNPSESCFEKTHTKRLTGAKAQTLCMCQNQRVSSE